VSDLDKNRKVWEDFAHENSATMTSPEALKLSVRSQSQFLSWSPDNSTNNSTSVSWSHVALSQMRLLS